MKRFVFPLQKLLEIRQKKEDQQKIILARASGEYQKELRKQQAIRENEEKLRERLKQRSDLDISLLRRLDYYGWQSKRIEPDLNKSLNEKRSKMEAELAIYTRLRQERRAVEILKEKAWAEHLQQTQREEQQILDEISQTITNKNPLFSDKQRGGEEV
jgi:flagellar export protein FliJ